jgi:hypothetical protein
VAESLPGQLHAAESGTPQEAEREHQEVERGHELLQEAGRGRELQEAGRDGLELQEAVCGHELQGAERGRGLQDAEDEGRRGAEPNARAPEVGSRRGPQEKKAIHGWKIHRPLQARHEGSRA